MELPIRSAAIDDEMLAAARAQSPELDDATVSQLLRVAVAVLAAGYVGRKLVDMAIHEYGIKELGGSRPGAGRPRKVK